MSTRREQDIYCFTSVSENEEKMVQQQQRVQPDFVMRFPLPQHQERGGKKGMWEGRRRA